MHPAQEKISALLESLVVSGKERGVQLAAYVNGEPVVDAWAGHADAAGEKPVDGATLFPFFSVGKGIASTAIHILVERGLLDYDRPIAGLWPEFAAEGKGAITLRHVLGHFSGLSHLPGNLAPATLCDWEAMAALIAGLRPRSAPGEEIVYHAITQAWLFGEPARRADGRPFGQIIREEIAIPLGIGKELFMGLPQEEEGRVAWLDLVGSQPAPGADSAEPAIIPRSVEPLHAWMNQSIARRACIPASNGIGTARAVARHYAALLPGGVGGISLLPPERIALATLPSAPRENMGGWGGGLGYAFRGEEGAFGHDGHGGSTGFADPKRRIAVGFTRNLLGANPDTGAIFSALYEALAI